VPTKPRADSYEVVRGVYFYARMPLKKIALIANTAWNLWNFRRSLIEALTAQGHEVICAAPEDGYENRLQDIHGVRFIPLRHLSRKSLSITGNLHTFTELRQILRREQPDLAVFYTIKPNIYGAVAARQSGVPAIAAIEGLGYAAMASPVLRQFIFFLYRYALKNAARVVFLNSDDRQIFLDRHVVAHAKTLIIRGTGIDTAYFSPGNKSGVAAPVFIFIGRLLSDKGVREFVRAAQQVKRIAPQAQFRLLGSTDAGNPASIGQEELKQWINEKAIDYMGQTDDVRPFIAGADIIVLPSYREGMPRVLLEGMAMGKAIITTHSAGCRETVEEGKNGFIVPTENADALADAMLRYLALAPEQQRAMGSHSRHKAEREFGNAVILPQYLRLINDVLQAFNKER
jgi:glycosyltransferase involved in cell wall biosynthesis